VFSWDKVFSRRESRRPLVIAHRGDSGNAPENTLRSFSQAMELGADVIELDVHLSADGVPVVIHDYTVQRTTDGRGRVAGLTLEELERLDAGSWFHRRFAGERVPTLEEALRLSNGRVGVNLEIKPVSDKTGARETVVRSLETIRRCGVEPSVLLSSFQHSLLPIVHKYNPRIALGIIYHPVQHVGRSPIDLAPRFGASAIVCAHRYLRKGWVGEAHRRGLALAAYPVDSLSDLRKCLRLNIGGIVTNQPGRILKHLENTPKWVLIFVGILLYWGMFLTNLPTYHL
jgi:glycerophosphoryl diester phosphodiesterase